MGTFRARIEIGDPQGQRFVPIEALVDTGASYTTLPTSLLRGLGVSPQERAVFDLADGREAELNVGETSVRIDGRARTVPVVFADEGTEPLLGAVTLEIFGLAVDPLRQRLVPVHRLLMAERPGGSLKEEDPFWAAALGALALFQEAEVTPGSSSRRWRRALSSDLPAHTPWRSLAWARPRPERGWR
jgi:clan AA aspartic protease